MTFAVFAWLMPRTLFGRYAYAIGSSAKAAPRAGVPVGALADRRSTSTSGGLAVARGARVRSTDRQRAAERRARHRARRDHRRDPRRHQPQRRPRPADGTPSSAFVLLGVVNNGLILVGVPAFWQQVVKGAILLLAVLYDELRAPSTEEA